MILSKSPIIDDIKSNVIVAFVDNVQMVKEHKDSLDDADIVLWNEVVKGKICKIYSKINKYD